MSSTIHRKAKARIQQTDINMASATTKAKPTLRARYPEQYRTRQNMRPKGLGPHPPRLHHEKAAIHFAERVRYTRYQKPTQASRATYGVRVANPSILSLSSTTSCLMLLT